MPFVCRQPSNPCAFGVRAVKMVRIKRIQNKTNDSVKKRGMKINVGKTTVMAFERGESTTEYDIFIESEKFEQAKDLIRPRLPEKKGLDRQTDGQQTDPIRVPFFLSEQTLDFLPNFHKVNQFLEQVVMSMPKKYNNEHIEFNSIDKRGCAHNTAALLTVACGEAGGQYCGITFPSVTPSSCVLPQPSFGFSFKEVIRSRSRVTSRRQPVCPPPRERDKQDAHIGHKHR
ncbi:hypothetical protein EVAR_17412_1 [Eumeta japonica]|uniref:Uncharacterized protein n=1 Tax=Eumeta variegata TaxID=151549 RepID=A0A4C1V9S7_EUMVA|nr:hypothetical protein EVAR_17412_1 [Eumeta japonica]